MGELNARGCHPALHASDAQLILHAYGTWGEQCVDHLLGDFAFAIWDAGARRLFCARDHFGIKPFYYAQVLGGIVFSNTLDCIRLHPAVGDGGNIDPPIDVPPGSDRVDVRVPFRDGDTEADWTLWLVRVDGRVVGQVDVGVRLHLPAAGG